VIKDSVVTVLGLTFKENVPDLRNTRVIDIVVALQDYGVEVQIHDPYASAEEAREEYAIDLLRDEQMKPADAVILAVPHEAYLVDSWAGIAKRLRGGAGIVMDVKAKLDRGTRPSNMIHWRL